MSKEDSLMGIILESATAEFLANGYDKASMRMIAKKANVTTGALYARFDNKDRLFLALVKDVAEAFIALCSKENRSGLETTREYQPEKMWTTSKDTSQKIVDLIYENKKSFDLLINCSTGSSYENFIEKIIEIEEKEVLVFLSALKKQGYKVIEVSELEIHILVSAQCYAMFEIVRHDLPKEQAIKQLHNNIEFFGCGWSKVFGLT